MNEQLRLFAPSRPGPSPFGPNFEKNFGEPLARDRNAVTSFLAAARLTDGKGRHEHGRE